MSHGPRARRASSAPPTSRQASPPANEAQASDVVGKLILVQTVEVSVVLLGSGSNECWLGRAPAFSIGLNYYEFLYARRLIALFRQLTSPPE
ncbi:hypothetical protein N7501_005081 [Penicillium viridicatum]|nr:hypothetical protein N7501_005081 [Penicillium viridicatum]